MQFVRIRRGLDVPVSGSPERQIDDGPAIRRIGLLPGDYVGMRPALAVGEGDGVRAGQLVAQDKHNPALRLTSPVDGTVSAIHRGAKRRVQSIVIDMEAPGECRYEAHTLSELEHMDPARVRDRLIESGLWCALRTRPFSKVPQADAECVAIFVTALDTHPLAPDPMAIIGPRAEMFEFGLRVLCRLTDGPVHLCVGPDYPLRPSQCDQVRTTVFDGPHPAGLPGTHIHWLTPVGERRSVWHVGYQDVLAMGSLFHLGQLDPQRVIALAGPMVRRPRLVRTVSGAAVADLIDDELRDGEVRVLSGSVLSGRRAVGKLGFVGRYHLQLSVLPEGRQREFLGWLTPGRKKFSATRAFLSSLWPAPGATMTTTQNGSPRAMVPIGAYERVMPLDLLATPLLRSLVVRDLESAQRLGCLELDEEDLALCSFVCPSKYEFGPYLRATLNAIEREG